MDPTAKFIQLVSHHDYLYAVDEEGQVWCLDWHDDYSGERVWIPVTKMRAS